MAVHYKVIPCKKVTKIGLNLIKNNNNNNTRMIKVHMINGSC